MNKLQNQSSKKHFEWLKFDTKLFGFKTAKILTPKLSLADLRLIINELKSQKVRLVYWQSASLDKKSQQAARKLRGFLASQQVTYLIDLKKIALPSEGISEVKIYRAKTPSATMKQLAIQIGILSRFGADPKMPRKLLQKLYHAWIKNSVNGAVADRVLAIRYQNKIVGMITLSAKDKRGDIRLVAVDSKRQGKKIGTKLVYAALNYFIKKGYAKAQVVTQKANLPACYLYEKCGFHQEKIDNFYHFWL